MRKAGDVLSEFINGLAQTQSAEFDRSGEFNMLVRDWSNLVGSELENHAELNSIEDEILIVKTNHPGWVQHIQSRQKQILKRINIKYPTLNFSQIRVFVNEK